MQKHTFLQHKGLGSSVKKCRSIHKFAGPARAYTLNEIKILGMFLACFFEKECRDNLIHGKKAQELFVQISPMYIPEIATRKRIMNKILVYSAENSVI